jgi:hypothetical protein
MEEMNEAEHNDDHKINQKCSEEASRRNSGDKIKI